MTLEARHRLKMLLMAVNLICSGLLLAFMIVFALRDSGETEFRIDARLSTLSVVASNDQPAWPASIPIGPAPAACSATSFRPAPGSSILFTQPGSGPIAIAVTAVQGGSTAGMFACKDGINRPAGAHVDALLDAAAIARAQNPDSETADTDVKSAEPAAATSTPPRPQPFSVRIIGAVTAGSEIEDLDSVPLMLESGDITMETVPLFGTSERVESEYKLNKGDVVNFERDSPDGQPARPVTFGFISDDGSASGQPGFHLIARTSANRAMILPYGRAQAGEVAVAPDFFARARAGAKSILLGAIGALALHILGLILALLDHQPATQTRKR